MAGREPGVENSRGQDLHRRQIACIVGNSWDSIAVENSGIVSLRVVGILSLRIVGDVIVENSWGILSLRMVGYLDLPRVGRQ